MSRVLRYEVPVDDQWHALSLPGGILHVAARQADTVELWATDAGLLVTREFRVFGTGQPLPTGLDLRHVGTAIVPGGALVWHLFEEQGR